MSKTPRNPNSLARREFLAGLGVAGASLGYSVMVKADETLSPQLARTAANPAEIKKAFERIAPPGDQPRRLDGEPNMTLVELECDLFIAGGGLAGVCAALAAARHGLKVVLVQDRSRLGGNASSEVRMHIVGADNHGSRAGWREGGLIEELRLENAAQNPHHAWELFDFMLYDKVITEKNITLLLDSVLYAASTKDQTIEQVMVRCDKTEHLYRIKAKQFADCTGDGRLALEAGASFWWGAEGRDVYNESLAPLKTSPETLGSSILFTSRKYDKPVPFTPPTWARKVEKKHLRFRGVRSWEYGYWWIEWGGMLNTIRDGERIRFELLAIVMGVWDYIKNSGEHPTSANWGMNLVGMIPGKRESRRVKGDHTLTQQDIMGLNGDFEDGVCIGGWPFDNHPPSGFDNPDIPPFVSVKVAEVYNIPYRCLYSKDIKNLFVGGRLISTSHVGFTSTRVMATCAATGQALGTAAALCVKNSLQPRGLYEDKAKLGELVQTLLRDDQTIKNRKNADPKDLARSAKVTASSEFETSKAVNVINGLVRDMSGKWDNRWAGKLEGEANGAWLQLAWDKPQKISQVQITFDSGFHRELTLTEDIGKQNRQVAGPQTETVKDYAVQVRKAGSEWATVAQVKGNYQRVRRHNFEAQEVQAVRLVVTATNGSKEARVYEVRCYA